MISFQICPDCLKKVMKYRKLYALFRKEKIEKPTRYKLCLRCKQLLSMEEYLEIYRTHIRDGYRSQSHSNCIVPCGYGMFAPRFYKEQVIDKRRT